MWHEPDPSAAIEANSLQSWKNYQNRQCCRARFRWALSTKKKPRTLLKFSSHYCPSLAQKLPGEGIEGLKDDPRPGAAQWLQRHIETSVEVVRRNQGPGEYSMWTLNDPITWQKRRVFGSPMRRCEGNWRKKILCLADPSTRSPVRIQTIRSKKGD
jgi:hypothetical protein